MSQTKKQSNLKNIAFSVILLALAFVVYQIFFDSDGDQEAENANKPAETSQQEKRGVLKTFSGKQFRELYDSIAYPNSSFINEKTPITGDQKADQRIRTIAEERGYKLRSAPVANNFVMVSEDKLLQPKAATSWKSLKKAAEKSGHELGITEAYRSAKDQKSIFLKRLGNLPRESIGSGQSDPQVDSILKTTALPGYSRHHTGYTVDISCKSDPGVLFEQSACFGWLSEDNYHSAKEHGWIPSYPKGAGRQGPEPEAWEYVWVGTDVLTE